MLWHEVTSQIAVLLQGRNAYLTNPPLFTVIRVIQSNFHLIQQHQCLATNPSWTVVEYCSVCRRAPAWHRCVCCRLAVPPAARPFAPCPPFCSFRAARRCHAASGRPVSFRPSILDRQSGGPPAGWRQQSEMGLWLPENDGIGRQKVKVRDN